MPAVRGTERERGLPYEVSVLDEFTVSCVDVAVIG